MIIGRNIIYDSDKILIFKNNLFIYLSYNPFELSYCLIRTISNYSRAIDSVELYQIIHNIF